MVNQMLARFFCRRYAPLLVPYAENALNEPLRSRVARHLDACPTCREEVALVSDMGALLRANPPATPAPADDLWKRIEAQILAEQPAHPAAKPIPVPMTVAPRSQWRSFVTGFGYSAVPVAAVVAAVVLVTPSLLNTNQESETDAAGTLTAMAPVADPAKHDVEITIGAPVAKPAPSAASRSKGAEASEALATLKTPTDSFSVARRVASVTKKHTKFHHRRFAVRGAQTPSLSPALPANVPMVAFRSTPQDPAGGQPIRPESTVDTIRANHTGSDMHLKPVPAITAVPVPSAAPSSTHPDPQPVPEGVMAFSASGASANGNRPAETRGASRPADWGAEKMEEEKKVTLAATEAVLPVREAPAERRVSDVTDQMFRHRNMFSYMR